MIGFVYHTRQDTYIKLCHSAPPQILGLGTDRETGKPIMTNHGLNDSKMEGDSTGNCRDVSIPDTPE